MIRATSSVKVKVDDDLCLPATVWRRISKAALRGALAVSENLCRTLDGKTCFLPQSGEFTHGAPLSVLGIILPHYHENTRERSIHLRIPQEALFRKRPSVEHWSQSHAAGTALRPYAFRNCIPESMFRFNAGIRSVRIRIKLDPLSPATL